MPCRRVDYSSFFFFGSVRFGVFPLVIILFLLFIPGELVRRRIKLRVQPNRRHFRSFAKLYKQKLLKKWEFAWIGSSNSGAGANAAQCKEEEEFNNL